MADDEERTPEWYQTLYEMKADAVLLTRLTIAEQYDAVLDFVEGMDNIEKDRVICALAGLVAGLTDDWEVADKDEYFNEYLTRSADE